MRAFQPKLLFRHAFFSLAILALGTSAHAEMSAREAVRQSGNANLHIYLDGIGAGVLSYNVVLKVKGGSRLYCPPDMVAITVDQYKSILRGHIQREPSDADLPVSLALLRALIIAFPCKGEK